MRSPPITEWVDEYGRLHFKVRCPVPGCTSVAELVLTQELRTQANVIQRRMLLERSYLSHLGQDH